MEKGGKVVTCDITNKYTLIAKQYWEDEGVINLIDQHIVPLTNGYGGSIKLLKTLADDAAEHNSFDIIFIDGAKSDYETIFELALALLRPGGNIILDNVLWSGRVADSTASDDITNGLRNLNKIIIQDARVDAVFMNSDDGMMLIEKLN
jgi:predicted O-methyltransferase YrrM